MAQNVLARADSDRLIVILLENVTDHKKDDPAVQMSDNHAMTSKGSKGLQMTTQEWNLKVLWIDGAQTLTLLKYLKESNPVGVVEFAKVRGM